MLADKQLFTCKVFIRGSVHDGRCVMGVCRCAGWMVVGVHYMGVLQT